MIQEILTNKLVHRLFVKPFIKNNILKTKYGWIDLTGQHSFIQSLIFWNVYERKEIRAIKKYLDKSLDIIELGSSIGLVSLSIGKILKNTTNKFISVEANPRLKNNLIKSISLNKYDVQLVNAAVSYTADMVNFELDERNLGSKISANADNNIQVKTTTVKQIFESYKIGKFCLVSDIEGAEVEIIFEEKDKETIDNCKQIIIELHNINYKNRYYIKDELANLILDRFNMKIIFTDQNIWVFNKKIA